MNGWYETLISKLPSRYAETTFTITTVSGTQDYSLPPNFRREVGIEATIGGVNYPLRPVFSQDRWNELNSITVQPSAIPKYYFIKQNNIGIYPQPGSAYTVTITYNFRAGGLTASDYTTGTVTVTNDDATVTGSGTTFTGGNVVAGMYFSLADSNGESKGEWYKISSVTDGTNLELTQNYIGTTAATQKYIIGESPELPDEMHESLAYGAVADYFAMFRQDLDKAQKWDNYVWTGSWSQDSRQDQFVKGGLIDMIRRYKDRSDKQLIQRGETRRNSTDRAWAETITT